MPEESLQNVPFHIHFYLWGNNANKLIFIAVSILYAKNSLTYWLFYLVKVLLIKDFYFMCVNQRLQETARRGAGARN